MIRLSGVTFILVFIASLASAQAPESVPGQLLVCSRGWGSFAATIEGEELTRAT